MKSEMQELIEAAEAITSPTPLTNINMAAKRLRAAIAAARSSEGGWIDARNQALREAATVASLFTAPPNARIHPDIAWDEMNESAKLVAHTTAQQISWAISELIQPPPLSVETPGGSK
jgi:hypothetical protein